MALSERVYNKATRESHGTREVREESTQSRREKGLDLGLDFVLPVGFWVGVVRTGERRSFRISM